VIIVDVENQNSITRPSFRLGPVRHAQVKKSPRFRLSAQHDTRHMGNQDSEHRWDASHGGIPSEAVKLRHQNNPLFDAPIMRCRFNAAKQR
jgi:hypothetical protein